MLHCVYLYSYLAGGAEARGPVVCSRHSEGVLCALGPSQGRGSPELTTVWIQRKALCSGAYRYHNM